MYKLDPGELIIVDAPRGFIRGFVSKIETCCSEGLHAGWMDRQVQAKVPRNDLFSC